MNEFSNDEFRRAVEYHKESFLSKFKLSYEKNEIPAAYANDEHGKLHNRLSELHNSDKKLNAQYFRIKNAKQRDKSLTIADVIKADCRETGEDQKAIFDFASEIVALYELKDYVYKLANPGQVTETTSKSNFTLTRRVLMFYYLIEAAKENSEYVIVDKTVIARFIESILTNKDSGKKISNSSIYDGVKEYYGIPEKATKKDLEYVKEKFNDLGITGIVEKIQKLIDKK